MLILKVFKSVISVEYYCEVKGDIGCKIHFFMVFAYKCVFAVCEHNHPTMLKINSILFFSPSKT